MIHLNPIEYPILNKKQLTLKRIDSKKFEIINSFDSRLFYGKKVQIFLNNTSYIGRYTYSHINNTITNYLIFENNAPTNTGTFNVTIYDTFIVPEDNQALTFQDLQEKFKDNKRPVIIENFEGINDIGSNNIVDGFQTLKIDQSLYSFKKNNSCILSNKNWVQIFTGIVENDKLNRYQLFLYSTNINDNLFINLELGITGNCEKYYIKNNSHFNQLYSFDYIKNHNNIDNVYSDNIELQLTKLKFGSEYYVTLSLKLNNDYTKEISLEGYINCRHPKDLWWSPNTLELNSGEILLLNSGHSTAIDQTLLYIDNNGEQRTITYGESILKEIELTKESIDIQNLNPGYYKILSENKPKSIPGNNDGSVNSDYFKTLVWSSATLVILQNNKYLFYTNTGHTFIGYLKDSKICWELFSVYGHIHSTDDLTVGNNKFVSQEQIDTWNNTKEKLDNYSWRPYLLKNDGTEDTVKIETSFNKSGDAAILFDSENNPIIKVRDFNCNLISTSIGALTVESENVFQPETKGTLIKQETLDRLNKLGIGYRLKDEQYVLINNNSNLYHTENIFFDLVKRVVSTNPGNKSINIGFENEIAKDNSILFGIGLKSFNNNENNKLIIGEWNNPVKNALIEFGIGSSNNDRLNAFWYTENKLFTVNGNFFNNDSDKIGYLLVNGQDPIVNDFVHLDEFAKAVNTLNNEITKLKQNTDDSIFVKLIPIDSNIKPIIRRIRIINENSEYNCFDILITLNGTNGFTEEIINEITEINEDGDEIKIGEEKYWDINDNYTFEICNFDYDNNEFNEDFELLDSDFYKIDDGNLTLINIPKLSILKITNELNNNIVEINISDYINSLDFISNKITLDVNI